MKTNTPDTTQRADAVRNKQRVLNAAISLFNTKGLNVPLEEIASEAGIGVGTIYRHFPTKQILFVAVVQDNLKSLLEIAERLTKTEKPGNAFFTFIDRVVQNAQIKRSLVMALAQMGHDATKELSTLTKEFDEKMALLLVAAQKTGEVRKHITVIHVRALIAGCLLAGELYGSQVSAQELIDLVSEGLRDSQ